MQITKLLAFYLWKLYKILYLYFVHEKLFLGLENIFTDVVLLFI